MGLTRSTFYDASPATLPDDGILARISTICDEYCATIWMRIALPCLKCSRRLVCCLT